LGAAIRKLRNVKDFNKNKCERYAPISHIDHTVWVLPFWVLSVVCVVTHFWRVGEASLWIGNSRQPLHLRMMVPPALPVDIWVHAGQWRTVSLSPQVCAQLLALPWVCNTSVLDFHTVGIPFSSLSYSRIVPLLRMTLTTLLLRIATLREICVK
jgi:hypothetical protein